ncbi:hypothetical protein D3C86_1332160 [compost metagenome]
MLADTPIRAHYQAFRGVFQVLKVAVQFAAMTQCLNPHPAAAFASGGQARGVVLIIGVSCTVQLAHGREHAGAHRGDTAQGGFGEVGVAVAGQDFDDQRSVFGTGAEEGGDGSILRLSCCVSFRFDNGLCEIFAVFIHRVIFNRDLIAGVM